MDKLTKQERIILLDFARKAIENALSGKRDDEFISPIPERLMQLNATFVTLTKFGSLRGCVGALEPKLPLIEDVKEHAVAAAFHDYRFPPVQSSEFEDIEIEISRLSVPEKVDYKSPDELLDLLKPHVHGVVIYYRSHRATFLPQVWNKIPDPEQFMGYLCRKMGFSQNLWREHNLEVYTYQVEEFSERDC